MDEIAFALMVHISAHDPNFSDEAGLQRLLDGARNNLPGIARFRELSANQKRRALSEWGITRRPGSTLDEYLMVSIEPELAEALKRYIRKLSKAIYYRVVGDAVPKDYVLWAMWSYAMISSQRDAMQSWIDMTPILIQGTRRNFDFGNRFVCRANYSDEIGALACVGQFSDGLTFFAVCAKPDLAARPNKSAMEAGIELSETG